MVTPTQPRARLSAFDAMVAAADLTGKRLFPFRLDRWLPLGLVAFLDRCGREGGGGARFPSSFPSSTPTDTGTTTTTTGGGPDLAEAKLWISEHLVLIIGIAVAALVFIVALTALILWINSRGVFMYIDNVATGRFDVKRPWSEHAEHAWSYFRWTFGMAMVGFLAVVALLVPVGFWVYQLAEHGVSAGPILGIVAVAIAIVLVAIGFAIFKLLLRDFAAPLQLRADIPCGEALGLSWTLAKANAGAFVLYVLLKIVFSIATAILRFVAGCVTCCIGFLPIISHTILQPVFYFERAWSLCLLRQAGWDLFPAMPAPAPVLPPAAPLPPPAI